MTLSERRETYRHVPVDLSDARFVFINTLFSISETCLYSQLVDLLDAGRLVTGLGYADIYRLLRKRLDQTHMEGVLKSKIIEHPEDFVELDPDAALALVDQQQAGKRLMLISNSDWPYARAIMTYAFDRFLPEGMVWQDLFELVIVAANKPQFFAGSQQVFQVVEGSDLLRPLPGTIPGPGVYHGCDATKVEEYLGLAGERILYVGDHVFADVRMSKSVLRWRTALILRELEDEVEAIEGFRASERVLATMMAEKERLESQYCLARLDLQRLRSGYGPQPATGGDELVAEIEALRARLEELDQRIAPLARQAAEVQSPIWGPLLRAGHEKSHLARQIERSADVYTSRVSNFLMATPFAYLRSSRGSMPHDPVLMLAHDADAGGTQPAWSEGAADGPSGAPGSGPEG
jgi:HAD superfamily 5'-nucleotidase-like hydrolase